MCDAGKAFLRRESELAHRMPPFLLLLLLLVLSFASCTKAAEQNSDSCSSNFLACVSAEKQRRPVCGTDDVTYASRCHLLQAQCQGSAVAVQHRGRCKESQPCLAQVQAERVRQPPLFVPTCLEDGTFAPVQCHADTGYCWCVTPAGKPVPNSSLRNARPNCSARGKSNTRRRSSTRGRKQKKDCGREDRSMFNKNLIKIFSTEYNRMVPTTPTAGETTPASAPAPAPDADRLVLDWKFSAMDKDKDEFLDKVEYRDLRRLIKKVVKPKRCAKIFTKLCDSDEDNRIARTEWATCLALDFDLMQESVTTLTVRDSGSEDDGSLGRTEELEGNDCHSDRKAALEEQKLNNSEYYIPECTPDGRYKIIQCYKSTGYCWCVQEDNGKPIDGTSKKDELPDCDSLLSPPRPMKGCSEARKRAFLKDLMDLMKKKMAASSNKTTTTERSTTTTIPIIEMWPVSVEEQAASWTFVMLDKDNNKVLERKEWKNLRSLVSSKAQLRRCGKRLPRHCDVNNDRKISIREWLNCVIPQRTNKLPVTPTSSSRRRGLNPLQMYLKGED
ncbi:SPARC-related modular calcium-binding protein 1 isoform X3 [Periplaneta americana]|uniref:SPARC-related modular calcium-binding protein 1 isoform X3 n=1 Tax=Periplaneta americana TaxID=6978 RepID=UPI0037E811F0